jgi:hypothetical protein
MIWGAVGMGWKSEVSSQKLKMKIFFRLLAFTRSWKPEARSQK